MPTWLLVLIVIAGLTACLAIAAVVWLRRSAITPDEATAYLRRLGIDLVRLPGRLRRLAADPRTPRRARWWLIGLAIYVASPIDPIPDVIPVIGHLDELILVPIILTHIRRMIPPDAWADHFPPTNERTSPESLSAGSCMKREGDDQTPPA